jgi:transposase
MPRRYPPEIRREAVQLLRSSGRSISLLAKELGVSAPTLTNWASQRDVDDGKAEAFGPRQSIRRAAAQRDSSWRLDSCSLRSTAETCASTVFADIPSRCAISLYM